MLDLIELDCVPDHQGCAAGSCQPLGQVDTGIEGSRLTPEPGQTVVLPFGPSVAAPSVAVI